MSERMLRWVDAHLVVLLSAILLLRGAFLWVSDLDLIVDESYYWDWSRQPDWCYYSKPPMVAWLIGAFTWLLGDYAMTVRLPTILLGTIFLGYFHATAKAFYGAGTAALALLLILATPFNVLANFIMTIDPPLYCFWMMAVYYLRRALFDQQPRAWLWAGCASAAALLSKQVAIALPVMLLVFLLLDRSRRGLIKREFLIYLLPIVMAALPLLLWNLRHDWVMFEHSSAHFGNRPSMTVVAGLKSAGELLLYQLLLASPLIGGVVVMVGVRAVIGFKRLTAERQFLVLMGPLLLLGVLLLSFMQKVQGNWPVPFYFAGLILVADGWQAGAWRKTLKAGLILGYLMVGTTYLLSPMLNLFGLQNTAIDPLKRFRHWHELIEHIQRERQMALPGIEQNFVVVLGHRGLASQLAFYLPDHPKVYRFETSGQVETQYEVWPGPVEFIGGNALVVSDSANNVPEDLQSAFRRFRFLAKVPDPRHAASSYYLYAGEGLKVWPPVSSTLEKEQK